MLDINYILILLITYLGLPAGSIVSYFAKEELKSSRKYFRMARPVVFSAAFFYFLDYLKLHLAVSLALSVLTAVIYYLWDIKSKPYYHTLFAYSILAVILYEVHSSAMAGLIFIFGVITSSIYYDRRRKPDHNMVEVMKEHLIYLIVGLLLFLI